jgi:hypothetical protein
MHEKLLWKDILTLTMDIVWTLGNAFPRTFFRSIIDHLLVFYETKVFGAIYVYGQIDGTCTLDETMDLDTKCIRRS